MSLPKHIAPHGNGQEPNEDVRFRYIQFTVAVVFLLLILIIGYTDAKNQNNVMFLILLALGCGAFFVFLPLDAKVDLGWITATGGAAIFAFIVWLTVPKAQDFNTTHDNAIVEKKELDRQLKEAETQSKRLNDQISKLISEVEDKQSQINKLLSENTRAVEQRTQGDGEYTKFKSSIKAYFESIALKTKDAQATLSVAFQFAEAARGNSSDASTCSTRGAQAGQQIAATKSSIDSLQGIVNSALGALN